MLTCWFGSRISLNVLRVSIETERTIPFEEFPSHFCWNTNNKMWRQRHTKTKQIARMVDIHPNQGEKFYLRLLLKHVRGSTSFKDIRTVENVECETFKEACVKLSLLVDDSQWRECMEEASRVASPKCLRDLFCNIILHCHVTNPSNLYQDNHLHMSEDFCH